MSSRSSITTAADTTSTASGPVCASFGLPFAHLYSCLSWFLKLRLGFSKYSIGGIFIYFIFQF